MRNIKLLIAYDGTDFSGWQKQKNAATIQQEIETALTRITNGAVTLHGAGRTDAGVHALGMTASFQTQSVIPLFQLKKGLNSMLPFSIRIMDTENMEMDFHARFSARAKTYQYSFNTSPIQSPLLRLYSVHIPHPLHLENMLQCLDFICTTHDFASFEATGSRDKTIPGGRGSIRTLSQAKLEKSGQHTYHFTFTGDGFLRHMVRNIVGTVLDTGKGKTTVAEFKEIVGKKDRSCAGATAPAHGLVLQKVYY